jgi:predicted signal transduction protein with EAL and GGDEF domain
MEASIGTSFFPDDGLDATTLVNCADMAMYAAKRSGRNTYRFFAPDPALAAVEARESVDDAHARERRDRPLHLKLKAHSNVTESVR